MIEIHFKQEYKTATEPGLECGWCKKPVEVGQVYLETETPVNECDRIWHKRCVDIHDGSLQGEDDREAAMDGRGPTAERLDEEDYRELHRFDEKKERQDYAGF